MTRHNGRAQALAAMLAALAGYVDASGFIATGGFFVSFMSGNSTRMGIGVAHRLEDGAIAASLIGAFLLGVICGAVIGHAARSRRRPVVLGLVGLLLASSASLDAVGSIPGSVTAMALAMGAVNNVFERNGEVTIGVTYMTGSLVKLGQRIAASLLGIDRFGWVSYLVLWLSFVAGVMAGAVAYPRYGLSGLWGAGLMAASLAFAATKTDQGEQRSETQSTSLP